MSVPAIRRGELHFLVYAPQNGDDIAAELGRPDYSYWFVLRYFVPVLERLGRVITLHDPETEADAYFHDIRSRGDDALLFLFMPPNKVPKNISCPALAVFAWEYSSIPTEQWGGDPRNDWSAVLREMRGAITHSNYALTATAQALPPDFPICSLPAPLWERYRTHRASRANVTAAQWQLDFEGVVLDSFVLGLNVAFDVASPPYSAARCTVALGGIVYSAVFNPNDKRKNWHDLLSAFVWAFRDEARATLLLKLVHHDAVFACGLVLHEMRKLAPYQCRVVAVHGFLDESVYARMVAGTTYAVNSSRGEGQCLPLMEFMSAGKPAIAPAHTAMAEYVNPRNSFVVKAWREWSHWPHDPRLVLRCQRYRIDWESLRDGYLASWQVATQDPAQYRRMSIEATRALARFCSSPSITWQLHRYLRSLGLKPRRLPLRAALALLCVELRQIVNRVARGLRPP